MIKMKVLELANHINRTKMTSKRAIKPEDPEYLILEPVVTEEMAEAALVLELRKPKTAGEVAAICGKSEERCAGLLWELAMAGVCFVNKIDDEDRYWLETWIPGVMEMMTNNRENVARYPQIAEAFEAYGRVRGPMSAGNFPIGAGLMRVIPIERSIEGETRRASYEEVSRYLNENKIFSVSDCACRTAREAMGEGCGHLKEDMCIQMGHAAEYYIRTGRGREISRDEAFDIIRRAEDNGLMHQIPNTDGSGKTHAICNCCGCSCLSLRTAEMFINSDMVRSNYVSRVDQDKCVACGECVEVCPVNALQLGQKLCAGDPVREIRRETPRDREWGPENWNPDYRTNRRVVLDSGSSPCKAECPAHIGIQGYVKLASQGKYREALELIKTENPFPAVCGRICPRKCESACTRGDLDDPVAIDEIKKFIAQKDLEEETRFIPRKKHDHDKKIAVIGAGPAGLTCAYFLAVEGYRVTVFEKQQRPGGMLLMGIPSFRLDKAVVEGEIDVIRQLGVEIRTGVEVGSDVTLDQLRSEGYRAFYVAVGAQGGRLLGLDGEDAGGVETGVEFLRRVNLGGKADLAGKTLVIGGGNVAIDVARTAVRCGASGVEMFCLEDREHMPALDEEIEEALGEGIGINNSWGPVKIRVEEGRVRGMEFAKCLSVFDGEGKFNPRFDRNDTLFVPADNILVSVGQSIEWGSLLAGSGAEIRGNRSVVADRETFQTGEADVFAGGDALTGPRFAIDAIAMGKEGALSIHRFVNPGQNLLYGRTKRSYRSFDKSLLDLGGYDRLPRESAPHVKGGESRETFADLRGILTEEQIRKETERCLGCGATVTDPYLCVGCGACTVKCRFDAITLERKYDAQGLELFDIRPAVMKRMVKRKAGIALMKPVRTIRRGLGL